MITKQPLTLPAHCAVLCEPELAELDGGNALEALLVSALAVGFVCILAPEQVRAAYTKVHDFFLSYKPMPIDG
jgi:hypothetical protein